VAFWGRTEKIKRLFLLVMLLGLSKMEISKIPQVCSTYLVKKLRSGLKKP